VWPPEKAFMRQFEVGEHVVIRYGRHQGKKAIVIKRQLVEGYEVKLEDGFVLFYSAKGLEIGPIESSPAARS
jgi:ribosomal protein L14E/L6E/L27E